MAINKNNRIMKVEGYQLVMLDTCTVSGLFSENPQRKTKILLQSIANIFELDTKPVISELTLIELIEGCYTHDDFKKLFENLKDCEFVFRSIFESDVCFLIQDRYLNYDTDEKLTNLKFELVQERNKSLFAYFYEFLHLYLQIVQCFLSFKNQNNFEFINTLRDIISLFHADNKELNKIINKYLNEFESGKNYNSKNLLIEFIKDASKLTSIDEKIIKNVVTFLENANLEKTIMDILRKTKFNASNFGVFKSQFVGPAFILLRNLLNQSLKTVDEIRDCLIFSILRKCFFSQSFQINELTDICNIDASLDKKNEITYYTDDADWNSFLKLEDKIKDQLVVKKIEWTDK